LRYIGSLVADFHRTMLKGGIFLYPPTQRYVGSRYEMEKLADFLVGRATRQ
jgi:fructose-1,6-bisphosphatase I